MSTKTTNYDMTLPAQEDYYDVDIFNENYEIIDEELKRLSDEQEGLADVASSGSYTDLEDKPTFNGLDYKPFTTVKTAAELVNALSGIGDNGGVIYLIQGTYDFTSTTLSAIGKDNVMLIGSGAGTVLKFGANTKLSFLGNRCGLKNLTVTREAASSNELILLDSDNTHTSADFLMDNVYIDCNKANASGGFIEITSTGLTNARFVNLVIDTDEANALIAKSATTAATGLVTGCCANAALTVPSDITLGTNIGITAG